MADLGLVLADSAWIAHLKKWVDNSLDIYKAGLRRVLYPVFVHCYLKMLAEGYQAPAKDFWNSHAQEHEATHGHDLTELAAISLPAHVEENQLARLFNEHKYRLSMSQATIDLLLRYLEDTKSIIMDIINRSVGLRAITGRSSIFAARGDDNMLGEDEGLPGHAPGRLDTNGNLPTVKLGPLPMDKELMADIEEELKEEDIKMKDASHNDNEQGDNLVDEFRAIKREESEDSPMNGAIPLPPYTAVDVEREIRLVKQHREMIKLRGGPGPALPSVAMYTFHNTFDG